MPSSKIAHDPQPTSLKILFVAAECTPIYKVGGLADMIAALRLAYRLSIAPQRSAGFDILLAAADRLLERDVQLAILGSDVERNHTVIRSCRP